MDQHILQPNLESTKSKSFTFLVIAFWIFLAKIIALWHTQKNIALRHWHSAVYFQVLKNKYIAHCKRKWYEWELIYFSFKVYPIFWLFYSLKDIPFSEFPICTAFEINICWLSHFSELKWLPKNINVGLSAWIQPKAIYFHCFRKYVALCF